MVTTSFVSRHVYVGQIPFSRNLRKEYDQRVYTRSNEEYQWNPCESLNTLVKPQRQQPGYESFRQRPTFRAPQKEYRQKWCHITGTDIIKNNYDAKRRKRAEQEKAVVKYLFSGIRLQENQS